MGEKSGSKKNQRLDLRDPALYINRELSWLKFDERILEEARDRSNPLFERIKFLGITMSNLDEFFMVRVASLKDMVEASVTTKDIAGMTPKAQLEAVCEASQRLVVTAYNTYIHMIIPALRNEGIELIEDHTRLNARECDFVDRYFEDSVYPVLTPMAVDSSRPFPLISNKSLNIAAIMRIGEGRLLKSDTPKDTMFATVQVPSGLPRVIELPSYDAEDGTRRLVLLEQIILRNIQKVFTGYDIICTSVYRVTRSADFAIEESVKRDREAA